MFKHLRHFLTQTVTVCEFCRLRLVCVVLLAIVLLSILLASGMGTFFPRFALKKALERQFAPEKISIGDVRWISFGDLEAKEIFIGDLASVKRAVIQTSPFQLRRRQIGQIRLESPSLRLSMQSGFGNSTQPDTQSSKPRNPVAWEIRSLILESGTLRLTDLGPGIPSIGIPVNSRFDRILLGGSGLDPAALKLQTAETRDLSIRSPYDPLARVLDLGTLRVTFTLAGLIDQRLESVELIEPTIYVGPDLFWLTDFTTKELAKLPPKPPGPPWTVGHFEIRGGSIVIATQGRSDLRLPFVLEQEEENMVMEDFLQFLGRLSIKVISGDYDYPSYRLQLAGFGGELKFALKEEPNASNVVNQLKATRVKWRDLSVEEPQLWATYDKKGIYAGLYGKGYGGDINGDFTLFFDGDLAWVGSLSVTGMNLNPITQALFPDALRIKGKLSGSIIAKGVSKIVGNTTGEFKLINSGKVEILSLDELLKKIPPDWEPLKKDMLQIMVKSFREYNYTGGDLDFAYSPPISTLKLKLDGIDGVRNLDLKYHHVENETKPHE